MIDWCGNYDVPYAIPIKVKGVKIIILSNSGININVLIICKKALAYNFYYLQYFMLSDWMG